jgi:hypothetical protein
MTHSLPHPAGILVVANRTCPCPVLLDEVARRVGDAPIDVLVVVPALNTRLRHWLSDVDAAVARARTWIERADRQGASAFRRACDPSGLHRAVGGGPPRGVNRPGADPTPCPGPPPPAPAVDRPPDVA